MTSTVIYLHCYDEIRLRITLSVKASPTAPITGYVADSEPLEVGPIKRRDPKEDPARLGKVSDEKAGSPSEDRIRMMKEDLPRDDERRRTSKLS
ncbi:hypothetical protein Tco_0884688 [Tanacetum coccineum]